MLAGTHARSVPPHPARSPLCTLLLWGATLQPKAFEGAGGGLHPCKVPPAGAGWVPTAGRGGCRQGSPYLPARPRLRQETGTAFPRARRAQPWHRVWGTRGKPGACAGSRAAGSESCLGLESPEKQREASLNPAKAKWRVVKRDGCLEDGWFWVGGGKEIFWRQQLWSEWCGGHPAGAGRGCRGQEQGAAGTSTTSRDRDRVEGVRGSVAESTQGREHGDFTAQSRGLWGCDVGRGANCPHKAPGHEAAPCSHHMPPIWGNGVFLFPSMLSPKSVAPRHVPRSTAPAAPTLPQTPLSQLHRGARQRTGVCSKQQGDAPPPTRPSTPPRHPALPWPVSRHRDRCLLTCSLLALATPALRCHPFLDAAPRLPLSPFANWGGGGWLLPQHPPEPPGM